MGHYTNHFVLLFLVNFSFFFVTSNASLINVVNFGAKPDGNFDSTTPFLRAWSSACTSVEQSKIYVPKGSFLLKQVTFGGPCKNNIIFQIDGTIVAPSNYLSLGNSGYWILFSNLDGGISINGGILDGKGDGYWGCKSGGSSCPNGARSISFSWCNNVRVSGLTSLNSQAMHMSLNYCKDVLIQNVNIKAPSTSPNTDGINMQFSTRVNVSHSTIMTGDDCISISQGNTNVWIEHVACGPGHGISIGSLGNFVNEAGVQNVTVIHSVFSETQNGVRIKSWSKSSNGYVRDIVFKNLTMQNAYNPIIIDQTYCPSGSCPHEGSSVKISRVSYEQIKGTSACPVAINFDCSQSKPCEGIKLQDINLNYYNRSAMSSCTNVGGFNIGTVIPKSCL
ncbi:polygalacturonase [Cajanus cajan]|uniref:Polygalacturonase n=1 Tax=Cajanus cajan TaxID=3821 RepID=A0A151QZA8_CAJCA|nr:polygalacturonase [Cajanus cajan]KYP35555.1 Polygalacturonase [Cajanus cajan]